MASYYGESRNHLPGSVPVESEKKQGIGKAARQGALKEMLDFYKQQNSNSKDTKTEQVVENESTGEKL